MKQAEITCTIDGCDRPSRAKQFCSMHYNRLRRDMTGCSVEGCDKPYFGRTYCSMHYERFMKYGDVGPAERTVPEYMFGYSETESKRYHKYGITPEEFAALLSHQDNHCALCPATYEKDKWHLDHDHRCCPSRRACNKCIRGILCAKCNMALGFLEANLDRLPEIESYLRSKEDEICG